MVTAAQAAPLATIQRLDPVFVDIQKSSTDLLKLRQQILGGQVSRDGTTRVKLLLEGGTSYPVEGTLRFADVSVDPTTGSQTIRALFPNPSGLLLPGMYVRAQLVEGTQQQAILVPQRAVSRDERGKATVMIVGRDNKVAPRSVQTDRTIGDNWLVTGGIAPGERVIVEGGMMLRPGMVVTPRPWKPSAAQTPAQGNSQAQGK